MPGTKLPLVVFDVGVVSASRPVTAVFIQFPLGQRSRCAAYEWVWVSSLLSHTYESACLCAHKVPS